MKKIFVRILILGIIVSLIFCPAVSARNTADGLEKIEIGDIDVKSELLIYNWV